MATRQIQTRSSARSPEQVSTARQCPHCGSSISRSLCQCPHCRETVPEVPVIRVAAPVAKRDRIRPGLLYMLLAAVIHYFAGGYSAMELPLSIIQPLTAYLSLLLFLGGLGLTLYGIYLRNS